MDWPTWIMMIATVALAFYAFMAHQDTLLIIDQQKTTEQLQFRAYISEISADIKEAIPLKNPNFPYSIHYGFKNSGLTPALNVDVSAFDTMRGAITNNRNIGAFPTIIDPGQSIYIYEDTSATYLENILKDSGNFLTIKISYDDFLGKKHTQTIKLVSQKGTPGFVSTLGFLSQTDE